MYGVALVYLELSWNRSASGAWSDVTGSDVYTSLAYY